MWILQVMLKFIHGQNFGCQGGHGENCYATSTTYCLKFLKPAYLRKIRSSGLCPMHKGKKPVKEELRSIWFV
ncbi:hypothetical protein KP509_25G058300 [Ceratopteris richardii]|uniref:Uncharacterized protein n=1 Tax=Ceratopteris richardii TaxID=49495 RepID=A0A8T2RSZ5_CERRI|nr:hypothetical protein KP509_25G058300 [Ceratopteris richardii]